MPELPELEALRLDMSTRLCGRTVARCELASVSALKTYDPPLDSLVGAASTGVERRGKYLCLGFAGESGDCWLVVHLALGGWIRWNAALPASSARLRLGPLALRVGLDSGAGFDVTEAGTTKRLALWVVRALADAPPLGSLGVDPLDPAFDAAALGALAAKSTSTLKSFLTGQRLVAGIGNAYSDEALHAAKLSPFRRASRLDDREVAALHGAIVGVLREAVERSRGLEAGDLKRDKKTGLRVHGRSGQACPVCGDTIRDVFLADRSLQYCPTCQTGGKVLADRRLSRLLK